MRAVRVGTSGWSYRHWLGSLYPEGLPAQRWLEHYATLFDTVEVNATFYRLPDRATVAAWAERTPPGFVFAVKGSRYLTHVRRLRDPREGIERLLAVVEPVQEAGKLGPFLWQLPQGFVRDEERLAAFLDALPPGRHCLEFRHPSWFCPDVYALLRERGVALVIGDHPQRPFQARELTADWTYLRFHHGDLPDSGYSDRALEAWAEWIDRCRQEADVYAYFNNDWAIGLSPESARTYVDFARRFRTRTIKP